MPGHKPIAFLFPGQASQFTGLGQNLYDSFQIARETFQEASDVLGFDMAELCFHGSEEELRLTANAQPSILTVSIAAWRIFCQKTWHNLKIVGLAGHSLGEYSALVAAGAMQFDDALRTVRLRGQAMQEAADAAGETMMAALIGLTFEQIGKICEDSKVADEILNSANFNSPKQVVISGHQAPVQSAMHKAKELGGKAILIKVSAPFHCDIMKPVESVLAEHFRGVSFNDLRIPVIKNIDAMPYRGAWEIPKALVYQTTSSVIWDVSVGQLIRSGAREIYVPCPGQVICGLMKQINPEIPVYGMDDFESMRIAFEAMKA